MAKKLNEEQIRRIIDYVREHPGCSIGDIDEHFNGYILGIGEVQGMTEEEFDAQMVGDGKPLTKKNGGYYVNPTYNYLSRSMDVM